MNFSSYEVHLPPCVEEMLRRICQEQAQAPPNFKARQCLALLGEERAMCLLEKLLYWNIRNLSACVIFLAKKEEVCPEESVCSPLSHTSTVRSSQDEDMVPSSPYLEQRQTSLHMALGELEFRKAFLILSYVGDKKLEKFVSLETIQMLMNLPMTSFEAQVWNLIGKECILETERRKNLNWDSQLTYVYQCHVGQEGKVTFKGPYLSKTKTHLQRVLGDENVLNVRFADEAVDGTNPSLFEVYQKIAKEGIRIPIGLRHYQFFVFKDGGKEEKKKNPTSSSIKCYFVCVEFIGARGKEKTCTILNKPIRETRATFMHIHTVANLAKYMARFSLILSKTIKLEVNLANVDIQFIEDIRCQNEAGDEMIVDGQPLILTDGTGYISKDLALKCGRNIYKGAPKVYQNGSLQPKFEERFSGVTSCRDLTDEPPLLIQFRLFNEGYAIKGTVLVNNLLPPNTIQIRPSMIKVHCDPKSSTAESVNSFEIVGTSNRPRGSDLSKHLITLLNYGGVPREYFTTLVQNALDDAQNVYANKRSALRAALRYGEWDNYLSARMILCGIPLDEPFLQDKLSIFMKEERKGFMKGKIPIDECYYLMGTADPTGMLRPDQVCIILDNGQISGKVLVYKNPGLHFGDIHVLTATYVKDLENIVGNAKYAIFFPTNGLRSLADEIANSDFDGDMYWVSRNPQLVDRFKQSEPWPRPSKSKIPQLEEPTKYSPEQLEYELFNKFLNTRFRPSNVIGTAADSWLVYMDRLLTLGDECVEEKFCLKKKMLQLVDIYYDALDAPKSGLTVDIPPGLKPEKFPHFMERENRVYTSKSILGEIYDIVRSFQSKDALPNEVCLLSCFGEVVPRYLEMWQTRYRQYREEMCSELSNDDKDLKNAAVDQVILKYKMMVYEAEEFEVSTKNREEIFNEALAIYQIAYKYAKTHGEVGRCGFPWKVAGHALCELYLIKQNENRINCSPSVLRDIFG